MPYSAFNYVNPSELVSLIPSIATVTNETLAARFISDAEYMIDALAGPAPKFYPDITGEVDALMASGATGLTSDIFGSRKQNWWAVGGVYLRIVESATSGLVGQERLVVSSGPADDTIVLATGFDLAVPAGTVFTFDQRSAFPRLWDQDSFGSPKMPHLLKQAVAAQVEYGLYAGGESAGLGTAALVTDADGAVTQRSYGSGYSESRDPNRRQGIALYIAPRARAIMQAGHLINTAGYLR